MLKQVFLQISSLFSSLAPVPANPFGRCRVVPNLVIHVCLAFVQNLEQKMTRCCEQSELNAPKYPLDSPWWFARPPCRMECNSYSSSSSSPYAYSVRDQKKVDLVTQAGNGSGGFLSSSARRREGTRRRSPFVRRVHSGESLTRGSEVHTFAEQPDHRRGATHSHRRRNHRRVHLPFQPSSQQAPATSNNMWPHAPLLTNSVWQADERPTPSSEDEECDFDIYGSHDASPILAPMTDDGSLCSFASISECSVSSSD